MRECHYQFPFTFGKIETSRFIAWQESAQLSMRQSWNEVLELCVLAGPSLALQLWDPEPSAIRPEFGFGWVYGVQILGSPSACLAGVRLCIIKWPDF